MLKAEVEIGGTYRVRWHDGSFTNVKVTGERRAFRGNRRHFTAINLKTGRHVVIKSAAKLRERVG